MTENNTQYACWLTFLNFAMCNVYALASEQHTIQFKSYCVFEFWIINVNAIIMVMEI
jgi:hypothetical protein